MRRFTAYELNLLNNYGIDPASVTDQNIPVEYIVGEGEFYENKFKVNSSTLIPRIESEYLIELALRYTNAHYIHFADIGCGSGAIGLTFGMELTKRNILFTANLSDTSDDALEVAKENYNRFKKNLGQNKVLIFRSNLLGAYTKSNKLDIIFANLPYIPSNRITKLDKSVREFEPITALDGGMDGLELIRKLLNASKEFLVPEGVILLEVDDTHKDASEFSNEWNIEIKNDFNGKIRYWVCKTR